MQVFEVMALRILFTFTLNVTGSTGTWITWIRNRSPALSNAACAVTGMTLQYKAIWVHLDRIESIKGKINFHTTYDLESRESARKILKTAKKNLFQAEACQKIR